MGQGVPRRYDSVRGDTRSASRRCPIPASAPLTHPLTQRDGTRIRGRCRPPVSVRWRLRLRGPACLLRVFSAGLEGDGPPSLRVRLCHAPFSSAFRAVPRTSARFPALRRTSSASPVVPRVAARAEKRAQGRERCRLRLPWPCGVPFYLRGRCSACACACFSGLVCARRVFRFSSLGHRRVVAVPSRFT